MHTKVTVLRLLLISWFLFTFLRQIILPTCLFFASFLTNKFRSFGEIQRFSRLFCSFLSMVPCTTCGELVVVVLVVLVVLVVVSGTSSASGASGASGGKWC